MGVSTKRLPSTTLIVQSRCAGKPGTAGQRQDRLARGIDLGRVFHDERQRAVAVGNIADADVIARLLQLVADRFVHTLDALLPRTCDRIGLEQDVAATGQIEARG